jgi:hypothetical protein
VSDDPVQFAAHCSRALVDDAFARRFSEAGRAVAKVRFAPERVYAPLLEALRAACVRRGFSAP